MKFKTWTHIGCDDYHYGGEYGEIDIKRKYDVMVESLIAPRLCQDEAGVEYYD